MARPSALICKLEPAVLRVIMPTYSINNDREEQLFTTFPPSAPIRRRGVLLPRVDRTDRVERAGAGLRESARVRSDGGDNAAGGYGVGGRVPISNALSRG